MLGGKIVVAGVSMILVVGVCIGLIAGVSRNGSKNAAAEADAAALSTASKSVAAICTPTDFKAACVKSLSELSNNESATPEDFLRVALKATMQSVEHALNSTGDVFNKAGANSDYQKMAKEDCEDLLQTAVQQLQSSMSMVGDKHLQKMEDRVAELQNWLSSVISYSESCLDAADSPQLKGDLSANVQDATQLTSNALAIVSGLSKLMGAFNITLPSMPSIKEQVSRRLSEVDEDEAYPGWMSRGDRKLLASQNNANLSPNAVVAKDGSGQYKTIAAALAAYPAANKGRYVIYVKAGVYDEYLTVEKKMINVFMYGDGARRTIVTGRKSYHFDGITTMRTASFSVSGNGFVAKNMGFRNTAGPEGHQAVALRVQADAVAFYNCRMDGYQDTLYVQAQRQFFRNCVISGTVDFIFGDASCVIQNSLIIVRLPMSGQKNIVTAQGKKLARQTTGIVIQNCRIVAEEKLAPVKNQYPSFLGRPWKEFSTTVIMETRIGDVIQPAGFLEWEGNFALDTLYYAEYGNSGPGAALGQRVKWKGVHVINRDTALTFTVGPFIQGNTWIKETGAPYILGLRA